MALSVFEEELGARDAMAQVLIERGFSGFTIPYVEAGYFTGGDYFAEVTQYAPSSVICTPRFSVPEGMKSFLNPLWTSTITTPPSILRWSPSCTRTGGKK
ncbi:MAG: hypothetical protein J6S17_00590 [Aeriscardovia sp.]|nr:hypothetical protein [Aeriscardovia sp.]